MQGGKKEQKQWTQVQAKRMEPKVCHKRALEQSCSKAPMNHKKHSKKEKRMELERVESLEEPSPCNDSALQIRDGLSSLQG
jgi:hypothetical protein